MHCLFDGERYRCSWESLAAFLDQRSLPRNLDPDRVCFGHLENRDRPQIVDGNVPWWLAAVIATPLVAISLYLIRRQMNKNEEKKDEEEGAALVS